jgi:RNA 2',3'-cyclic 3'-phosphodiesterase
MIRSFIAVETPKDVRDGISALQANLKPAAGSSVRWVANDNLHLTLIFLGEVEENFLNKVKEQLTSAVKTVKSFEANLNGIGAFPSQRSPRIIWIGMDKGKDEAIDLQATVEKPLITIGYKPEDRKFHPHLTVGRVKGVIKDPAKIFETNYTSRNFPVKSIVLFKSTLRPEGPVYEKLQEFNFG